MGNIKTLVILFLSITSSLIYAQTTIEKIDNYLNKNNIYNDNELLFVSIKEQKMYHIKSKDIINEFIISTSEYGIKFTSCVHHENIYGIQFHPEKSHSYGEKLLYNFAKL